MELVEGKTLRELIASGEPLPTKKLLDVAVQTAEGLAKAHARRHRAPRPEARERHGLEGRLREDPGLRPGQADRARLAGRLGACRPRSRSRRSRAPSWARPATCRPSRRAASPSTSARTSSRWARSSTRWRRARSAFQRKTGAETLVAIIREEPAAVVAARSEGPGARALDRRAAASPRTPRSATPRPRTSRATSKSLRDHLTETSASGALEVAEPAKARRRGWMLPAALALLVGSGLGLLRARSSWDPRPATAIQFQRLTFQRGTDRSRRASPPTARRSSTAPPGRAGRSSSSRRGPTAPSRGPSACPEPTVLSISSTGELAVSLGRHFIDRLSSRPGRWRGCRWPAARRARSSRTSRTPTGPPTERAWPYRASSATGVGSSIRSERFCTRPRVG